MPDQIDEDVKRDRIERLIDVVQRSAATRNANENRPPRRGARRGTEPHRSDGAARTHAAEHDRQLHRPGRPRRARPGGDHGRHVDDAPWAARFPRPGVVASRDLVWEGCLNVRDLGGLPTEDGEETRFGSVIRADSVGLLTGEGWQALLGAGVTRIVDLRADWEIDGDPPRDLDVEVIHVPVLDHVDEDTWEEVRLLAEGASSHAAATEQVYLRFLDHCRPSFVEAVAAVATSPGPVVFHCHAGKDRTGLVAAILLRLAGVPVEVIAEDYALSGIRLEPRHQQWLASAADAADRLRIERITATPVRRDDRGAGSRRPAVRRRRPVPAGRWALAGRARSRPHAAAMRDEAERRGDSQAVSVIAIFGPTASGKSAVAEAIARREPADLVAADSAQLYRGLPLLTNQSPAALVGIWDLDHEASVGEYQALAHDAIDAALADGRRPVVVGGTGLYFRAALAEINVPACPGSGCARTVGAGLRSRRRRRGTRAARDS